MEENFNPSIQQNDLEFNQLVQHIKRIIEQEPNPYLAGDMEDSLFDICEGQQRQLSERLPIAFKQPFVALVKQVQRIEAQRSERLRFLRKQVESIQPQEIQLWESASLLMKLNSVKALSETKRRSILRLFKEDSISSQNFVKYFGQLCECKELDKQKFEQQLRAHGQGNQSEFLLNVMQRRPPIELTNNVNDFLQRYRRRLSSVQTWILKISDQCSQQLCVQGAIVKAQVKDNLVRLTLQQNINESKVIFSLNGNYISSVDVCYESQKLHQVKYSFKNAQSSYSNLSLKSSSKYDPTVAMLYVQSRKKILSQRLLNGESKQEYEQLIDQLISRQLTEQSYLSTKIYSQAVQLAKLQSAIGNKTTPYESLIRLLKDANFHSTLNVGCSIFSRQTVQMFKQAKYQAALLKNKQIISFYGKTGAGKSTSINHFSGIKLSSKKILQNFQVFEVSNEERDRLEGHNRASIGHSFVISDTLYSKGFSFLEGRYSSDLALKDVLLCDNPGFQDTRGDVYEIVTSYSIDRAIHACGSIKAIVLVIEMSYLKSGRSTDLFESIHNLQKLFPSLLDVNGSVFKHFYIFFSQKETKYTLTQVYKMLGQNKSDIEKQNAKNGSNVFVAQVGSKKLIYTNALIEMCKQKRVILVDLNEDFEQRQQHLMKIMNQPGAIDKKLFVSPVDNKYLEKFIQNVMDWSSAWQKLVFNLLKEFPSKMASAQQGYELKQQTLGLNQEQKMSLPTKLTKKKQQLATIQCQVIPNIEIQLNQLKSEAERLHSIIEEDKEYKYKESTFLSLILDERQESLEIEKDDLTNLLKRKAQNATAYQKQIKDIDVSFQMLGQQSKILKEKISSLNKQTFSLTLYRKWFDLGSTYVLEQGEYIYEKEWSSYLLSIFKSPKQIIVGEKERLLMVYLDLYRENYKFIYDQSFDPQHLFQKVNTCEGEGYDLVIHSLNVVLKDCQVHEFKNTLHFYLHFSLPCNNIDACELPYIQIKKNIPGTQFYKDAIEIFQEIIRINKQETQALVRQRGQLVKNIQFLEEQIKSLSLRNEYLKQKIRDAKQYKQQLQVKQSFAREQASIKEKNLGKMRQIADSLKKQLEDIQKELEENHIKHIQGKDQTNKLLNQTKNLRTIYKRLAFMFRDQQQQGTLQILDHLARIVIELTSVNRREGRPDNENKIKEKVRHLEQFLTFYDSSKADIDKIVSQLLQ